MPFFSSKTGKNVNELFTAIGKRLYNLQMANSYSYTQRSSGTDMNIIVNDTITSKNKRNASSTVHVEQTYGGEEDGACAKCGIG